MINVEVISIFLLVVLSAFFSASETALVSVTKQQLHKFKKEKRHGFRSVLLLRKNPSSMITTILIGNNIVNIAATSLSTQIIISILEKHNILNPTYITLITTGVVAFFLLIFGEVTPKNIALAKHENMALFSAPLIRYLSFGLSPFVNLMSWFSSFLIKRLGGNPLGHGSLLTEQEILDTLDAGRDSGAIEHDEQKMMSDVIKFGDKLVGNVMTPMERVVAIDENFSLKEIMLTIKDQPRSRLPVYRKTIHNVIGLLYLKDLLFHIATEHVSGAKIEQFKLSEHQELIRKPFIVYAHLHTTDILKVLRAKKTHLAIVRDRGQHAVGIVTIEDLIEEIIGEIQDEYEK